MDPLLQEIQLQVCMIFQINATKLYEKVLLLLRIFTHWYSFLTE